MSPIEFNEPVVHLLTSEKAQHMLRNAPSGSRFYVHIKLDAEVDEVSHYPSALRGSLRMPKASAVALAKELYSDVMEAKGGRIRLSVTEYTTTRFNVKTRKSEPVTLRSYWIG